ncbi:hypothetical protein ZYGM_000310 [Zygosaccharomyces mellis]|uniref:DNA replication regulator Sld3 C-terminal domain-containing protein n=1 Tax=Zygosaccharomyces mellis TaxID=42258 RepID=A0A4C2EAJ4_9SACH|nr:hypothetical protein ZYGM_000310 [Zygosaccharomyces mellis]
MSSWRLIASVRNLPLSLRLELDGAQVNAYEEFVPNVISETRANKIGLKHLIYNMDKCYLLERYGNGFWICYEVIQVDLQEVEDGFTGDELLINWAAIKEWNLLGFKDLLPLWREDYTSRQVTQQALDLEMRPPGEDNSHNEVMKLDPATFLETKYYDSLFNIHLPLAYFVKSTLSRLKNACNVTFGKENAYLSIILGSLKRIDEFDQRHADGGLVIKDLGPIAAEQRQSCLEKFGIKMNGDDTDDNNDKSNSIKELPAILKIREIKLQIVILLETIAYHQLDANFENFESRYRSKLKKRSLNLTKQKALPMKSKLNRRKLPNQTNKTSELLDYCEQLDLYLDKICILDILLASEPAVPEDEDIGTIQEHKKNLLNKHKESSSVGFINYVLVPYFAKRVPNAVKFTIQKLKGPSLRSRRTSERSVPERSSSSFTDFKQESLSRLSSTPSSPQPSAATSWYKNNTANQELLNTKTGSNAGSLFESGSSLLKKPAFISRTKSDLTMNLMRKRQLSVTELSSNDRTTIGNNDKNNGERARLLTQSQKSFRRVGIRKSEKDPPDPKAGKEETKGVQVMSTPLVKASDGTPNKRAKLHNIVESPVDARTAEQRSTTITNEENSPTVYGTPQQNLQQNNEQTQANMNKSRKNIKRRLFAP